MNSDISRLHVGVRLSGAVVSNNVVYLAGQVPRETINGDIKEQTAEVLDTIDRLLEEAGSSKSRILSCQIFLKNSVWDAWIPAGQCPARATVQALMANPKTGIEIVVTAALNPR
jgi:enamine deaminase RidA (YjgF/YER057c/UK114 family)